MGNVFEVSLNCLLSSTSTGRQWQNADTVFSRMNCSVFKAWQDFTFLLKGLGYMIFWDN